MTVAALFAAAVLHGQSRVPFDVVEATIPQMQTAMRASRAASLRAAQTLADSYTALVSGVLIGMSDALREGGAGAKASRKK